MQIIKTYYSMCIFSTFAICFMEIKKGFFLCVALTGPRSAALTGPRSAAINRLHPCSHWPLFAIALTHDWIGTGANQTCTWALQFR